MTHSIRCTLTHAPVNVLFCSSCPYSQGFSPKFGARPMRRTVQRLLENPLSECLLDGFATKGDEVTVRMSEGAGGEMGAVVLSNSRGDTREFNLEDLGSGSGGIEEGESVYELKSGSYDEDDDGFGGGGLPLPGFDTAPAMA